MFARIYNFFQYFRQSEKLQILFLCLLSTAIFSYQINRESLWLDEVYTYYASDTWESLTATIGWKEKNMWLYHILMYFWKFLGPGEAIMRLLSVIFGVCSVVAMYKLGKEIQGKLLGFIVGLFLSLNTHFLYYTQEARGYTLFVLFFILSSLYLVKHVKTNKAINRNLYVVFVIASFFTHLYTIIFVPFQAIFLLWHSRSKKKLISFIGTYLVIGLGLSPIVIAYIASTAGSVVTKSAGALSWIPMPGYDTIYKFYLSYSSTSHALFFINIILIIFVIVNFFVYKPPVLKKNANFLIYFLIMAFVPTLFLFVFSLFIKPLFIMRYLLFVLPAFLMVIALSLVSMKNKRIFYFVLFVMVVLNLNILRVYHDQVRKEQWREVTQLLNDKYKPGDSIIVFPESSILPLSYYDKVYNYSLNTEKIIIAFPKDLRKLSNEEIEKDLNVLLKQVGKSNGVWLITRAENLPISRVAKKDSIEKLLEEKYQNEIEENKFKYLKIHYFSQLK